jgi:hypothetical protein
MMGVYKEQNPGERWNWQEQHLYGSSRLGMWLPNIEMDGSLSEHYDATEIGTRNYELTNHLGNVMAVVTDRLSEVEKENYFRNC